jgi:hypothetical protein
MPDLTIAMTPSTCMPIKAWEEITPKMCSGMQQLIKHVKDNPNNW